MSSTIQHKLCSRFPSFIYHNKFSLIFRLISTWLSLSPSLSCTIINSNMMSSHLDTGFCCFPFFFLVWTFYKVSFSLNYVFLEHVSLNIQFSLPWSRLHRGWLNNLTVGYYFLTFVFLTKVIARSSFDNSPGYSFDSAQRWHGNIIASTIKWIPEVANARSAMASW